MKIKLLSAAVVLTLACLVLATPAYSSPAVRNVTMYFHGLNAPVSVCGLNAWSIFNTTTLWTAQVEPSGEQTLDVVWTMYPVLAGDLKLNGPYSVSLYIKANATATGSKLQTWLYKRSPSGTETSLKYASTTIDVDTTYQLFTITSDPFSHTVPAGYTLRLEAMVNKTGAYTFYIAYGSATYPSKIVLAVEDHMSVAISSDKDKVVDQNAITFTATVKDCFGGYDLETPTITIRDINDVVKQSSVSMTSSNVGDTQYENTWTYTYKPYDDVGTSSQGIWDAYASVTDKSANSLTSQTLSFTYQLTGSGLPPESTTGGETPSSTNWIRENFVYIVIIGIVLAVLLFSGSKKRRK